MIRQFFFVSVQVCGTRTRVSQLPNSKLLQPFHFNLLPLTHSTALNIDISQHLFEYQTVEVGATVIGANINLADK